MTADGGGSPSPVPARRTLRCRTVAEGRFKQLNYRRGLPPLAVEERFGPPHDAPVPAPLETLPVALGSGLGARIHADAVAGSIVARGLERDVATSPAWTPLGQVPVGSEALRVAVRAEAEAAAEALRALIARAVPWSAVASTLPDPVRPDVALLEAAGPIWPA